MLSSTNLKLGSKQQLPQEKKEAENTKKPKKSLDHVPISNPVTESDLLLHSLEEENQVCLLRSSFVCCPNYIIHNTFIINENMVVPPCESHEIYLQVYS